MLTCDTNRIHGEPVIWLLPYYVHRMLAIELSSCMFAKLRTDPMIVSLRNNNIRSHKLLRSYLEVVSHLLKSYLRIR